MREKWYHRFSTLVWAFVVLGPLWIVFLPFVWTNPDATPRRKAITTVIMLVLTWIMVKLLLVSLGSLKQYYEFVLPK